MKLLLTIGTCILLSGCMNSGSAFNDVPDTKAVRSEPPSAAAADHAIADPSLNTVNDTNTIKQSGASQTPTGWIDNPRGE